MSAPENAAALAEEMLSAIGSGTQVSPLTGRGAGLDMPGGYAIGAQLRRLREDAGETVVGRKIGFTNRAMWPDYRVDAPMWGYMYDHTVRDIPDQGFSLAGVPEPQIEPEIVFHLTKAPSADMDDAALWGCIDWVAHGFEIVQSPFPGWRFLGPDTVAAGALHAALLLGEKVDIRAAGLTMEAVGGVSVDLTRNGDLVETGAAANVLDHPLAALRRLVELAETDPHNPAVGADEVITTGSMTKAYRIAAGEIWSTAITGAPLPGLTLRLG